MHGENRMYSLQDPTQRREHGQPVTVIRVRGIDAHHYGDLEMIELPRSAFTANIPSARGKTYR